MRTSCCILSLTALLLGGLPAMAQLKGEQNVTITMDMQPILQLSTSSPNQMDFVFDDITDYSAGITKYGGTILKVSASVNWDLYAIGTSSGNVAPGYWDQQIRYGTGGSGSVNQIPLSALEIRQGTPNNNATAATGTYSDYSSVFPPVSSPAGSNCVYVDPANAGTPPTSSHKYIAGHSGTTGTGNDAVAGGSYLTAGGLTSDYYYTIDYRIVPGLPAVFPMAYDASGSIPQDLVSANTAGTYAQPGVYTMNVQFVLVEDQ